MKNFSSIIALLLLLPFYSAFSQNAISKAEFFPAKASHEDKLKYALVDQPLKDCPVYEEIKITQNPAEGVISPGRSGEGLIRLNPAPAASGFVRLPESGNSKSRANPVSGGSEIPYSAEEIKSLTESDILLKGDYAAFKVTPGQEKIEFIPVDYTLCGECAEAIKESPSWLRDDLIIKFRELKEKNIDAEMARVIIKANESHANFVDEVAFQVAHLSTEAMMDPRFNPDKLLLLDNVQYIYRIEDSLKYVELVEYRDSKNPDNYYTTTRYKVWDGEKLVWDTIPKDIYYWYIVHPKIYQEGVYKKDKPGSEQQRTYGHFWNDYIWNNPEENYDYRHVNITTSKGEVGEIPRFGEIIQKAQYYWDRRHVYYTFNRPFSDNSHALDIIGNWASQAIPISAKNNRPVQPNQALYEHDGNCGEDAYLVAAACRSALIPIIHLNTSCEDHAFGAIYSGGWQHFEFFRGGLAEEGNEFYGITSLLEGGSYGWVTSMIEGTRPDGFVLNFTNHYTDTTAKLNLTVLDDFGTPVDGARIMVYASPYAHGQGAVFAGRAWADSEGKASVDVGADDKVKTYYCSVYHDDFGTIPEDNQVFILTSGPANPGAVYNGNIIFAGARMKDYENTKHRITPDTAAYGIQFSFTATEILKAFNNTDSQKGHFRYKNENSNASIGFFICDEENFNKFKKGQEFESYQAEPRLFETQEPAFGLPEGGPWYVVADNSVSTSYFKKGDFTLKLLKNFESAPQIRAPELAYPAPGQDSLELGFDLEWENIEGATGYSVQVSLTYNFLEPLVDESGVSKNMLPLAGLDENTKYYWRVKAANEFGESRWAETRFFITRPPKTLAALSLIEPANKSFGLENEVAAKWEAAPNAKKYQVQLSERDFFIPRLIDEELNENEFRFTGLEYGVTYYWRARYFDGSDWSPWPSEYKFTVKTGTVSVSGYEPHNSGLAISRIIPNPASSQPEIVIYAESAASAFFSLYDNLGKMAFSQQILLHEGVNRFRFNIPGGIANGPYRIVVKSAGLTDTETLNIAR